MENSQKLKLKNDIVFKAFFSKAGNEKFLNDFLNALLEEEVKIKQIKHDARLEQLVVEEKYGILDLEVELESGEIVDVEMQLNDNKNIERRTTFYGAKKIAEQKYIGRLYNGLKKVIIIALLDYDFIPFKDYVTKTVRVIDKHRDYEINNYVEYYYVELKKFRKQTPDMKEKINQWLAFIDGERGDLIDMAKKESKIIKEADKEYNVLTGDEEIKRLAEIRMLSEMEERDALNAARAAGIEIGVEQGIEEGLKQGIEEGLKQGIEEGKKKGIEEGKKKGIEEGKKKGIEEGKSLIKVELAKKMIKSGFDIQTIQDLTGLTIKEITELKNT